MHRRHGMESKLGVGGGAVISKEAQQKYGFCAFHLMLLTNCEPRSLDRAEDLCRRRKPRKALPFLLKAMEDGNNLDAFVQAAFLFPLPEALKALENAEAKGGFAYGNVDYEFNPLFWAGREGLKQRFGMDCFNDGSKEVGKFYSILET